MKDHVCSNDHVFSWPETTDKCPVYVKGCPCPGEVKRVGPGSRKEASYAVITDANEVPAT